jgi:hypothetical protein
MLRTDFYPNWCASSEIISAFSLPEPFEVYSSHNLQNTTLLKLVGQQYLSMFYTNDFPEDDLS